jgi:CheY-like chemotaxis protein
MPYNSISRCQLIHLQFEPAATMSEPTPASQDLSQWVRACLTHLYDTAFLQIHPLGAMLDGEHGFDNVTRAQRLRRTLLDCTEMLRPRAGQTTSSAARAYAILTYRYVDGLSIEDVMDKLSLSRRQVYREHEKAIEAITSVLAEAVTKNEGKTVSTPTNARDIAEVEIDRLRQFTNTNALALPDLLENVLQLLRPLAQEAQCHITVSSQTELPPVNTDRVQVRQALINVLTQAIGLAQPRIDIELVHDGENALVIIMVQSANRISCNDAPDEQRCVELAIARSLIEAQGGRMQTTSNSGWQVVLHLPIARKMMSILVIDDNADLVELFRRYLGGHRVHLVGVSESARALQLSIELQPQLITLDVMMPNFDGWDILQQLKHNPATRNIPVVVCSVVNEARLALSMGASGYLTKPVNQMDFLAMTRRFLGADMVVM